MLVNCIVMKVDLFDIIVNLDYRIYEKRKKENFNYLVEDILLVCMGYVLDLVVSLKIEILFKVNVEVVDILLDKLYLEFKCDVEVEIKIIDN